MRIERDSIEFQYQDLTLEARLIYDAEAAGRQPGILIAHAWKGPSDYEEEMATELAEMGYVAFVMDVYGKGKRGNSIDENRALMQPLIDDRGLLQARLAANLECFKQCPQVEPGKVAAIGFCFGGLAVLDMARMDAGILGVVSFHGILSAPANIPANAKRIQAKVLVLHGWDDPMATPESLVEFAGEMNHAGADWQIHAYGHTLHSFTNKAANNPDFGTLYNAAAHRRSWLAMQNFLDEVFE